MQFYVSHSNNTSYIHNHYHTPLSPCSIPGCNASCCVPVSSTTYTSRLWKKLVQTFATACHNTSEHMFTLCLQCVYNVFTGCLQGVYSIFTSYLAETRKTMTPWNNGKSGAKLDLTSSTTPRLQIHKFDHIRTANPCDWLLCCRAALLLVGYPHSLVYLHLPVVEGLIF